MAEQIQSQFGGSVVDDSKPPVSQFGGSIADTTTEVSQDLTTNDTSFVDSQTYAEENKKEEEKLRLTAYQKLLDRDPEELKNSDLPPPNTQMYDGLSSEDANKLYKIYRQNENARIGLFGRVLESEDKDRVIPIPTETIFKDDFGTKDELGEAVFEKGAKVSLADKAMYGVGNALKWIGLTGAAGIDYVANKLEEKVPLGAMDFYDEETGEYRFDYIPPEELKEIRKEDINAYSLASAVDKNVAETDPGDSLGDTLILEGSGLVVGGVGGFKLADRVIKYAPKIPNVIKGLAKFTSVEAGMSTALSPDVGTFLVGENTLFGDHTGTILQGVDVAPNSPEYEQILAKKTNILMDALLIAKPAEGVIRAGVWASKGTYNLVIEPILNIGSRSRREKEIVNQILDKLALASNPGKYGADLNTVKKELVKLIEENQEVIIKMADDEEIKIGLDTMGALERALASDTSDEQIQAILSNARGQRQGALAGGEAQQLEVATGRASKTLDDLTTQTDDALATESMLDAADNIAQQGLGEIATAKSLVDDLTKQIDDAGGDVVAVLKNNPVFEDLIGKIDGVDFNSLKNASAEDIIKVLEDSYGSMTSQKNAKYAAVKGGEVNSDDLFDILSEINPGQLDAGASSLNASNPLANLLKVLRQLEDDVITDGVNVSAKERLDDLIQTEGLDFGQLYKMRGDLAVLKNDFFLSKNPEQIAAARIFDKFVKFIDEDALDFVIKGGGEAGENAKIAKEYYKDTYAPIWNDGALKDYVDVYSQNYKFNKANYMQGASDILEDTITNKNKYRASHLINSLDTIGDANQASLVTDYIIGDIVSKINVKIKSGVPLDNIGMQDIVSSLTQYSDIVARNFPEEATRISTFIDNLKNQRGNVDALTKQLDEAISSHKAAEDLIYTKQLSEFFDRSGRPVAPENVYQAFNRIFNDSVNGGNTLDDILERAGDDPIVLDGIKVAYQKHLRGKIFGANIDTVGARSIKTTAAEQIVEELQPTLEYGRKIFKDTPEVIDGYEKLIELSYGIQRSKGAKAITSDSSTVFRAKATQSVDRLVTMIFGVLSRVGARVRIAASGVIRNLDTEVGAITDDMLANPEEFVRIAKKVTKDQLPTDVQDVLWAYFTRVGVYNEDNENEKQEFMKALADVELQMTDNLMELEKQSQEIFSNKE